MKTSARNQFRARVSAVHSDPVDAELHLTVANGMTLVSVITSASVQRLGLAPGKAVTALVKASAVILMATGEAKTSARNRFCGTVQDCREGAVNGEVTVALEGTHAITAIVTNASIRKLGLRVGAPVCALVNASNVILAVED